MLKIEPYCAKHYCPTELPGQHLSLPLYNLSFVSLCHSLIQRSLKSENYLIFHGVPSIFSFPGHAWQFHKCLIPKIWVSEKN